jgi:hypothetical protein
LLTTCAARPVSAGCRDRGPGRRLLMKKGLICWLTVAGIFLLWSRPAPAARDIRPSIIASLEKIFPPEEGYYVGLPLRPSGRVGAEAASVLRAYRIVVGDSCRIYEALQHFGFENSAFRILDFEAALRTARTSGIPGYRGISVRAVYEGKEVRLQVLTVNMDRWLLWARDHYFASMGRKKNNSVRRYAVKLSDYLYRRENALEATLPLPSDDGLKPSFRFMADSAGGNPGNPVEREECRDALERHRALRHKMFKGEEEVEAGQKEADWLIRHRPRASLSVLDDYRMQRLYQDFLDAGGSLHGIHALSASVFAGLPDGTYSFALDEVGRVRFARETGPESVSPAHAILFPGEKILAAGRFTVTGESGEGGDSGGKRIASIDIDSQDFFYRCGAKHLERDLKKSSDEVFFRVGHVLAALDRMQIPYQGARLKKF